MACLVVVGLLGLAGLGWTWGNDVLNTRADAEDSTCDSASMLHVTVHDSIAEPVEDAAETWNADDRVVFAHCITVRVRAAEPEHTHRILAQPETTGGVPALWIPESSEWPGRLADANEDRIASDPEPVVASAADRYPLIRINGSGVDDVQDRAAQRFSQFLHEPEQRAALRDTAAAGSSD